jgi:hypothetical protein
MGHKSLFAIVIITILGVIATAYLVGILPEEKTSHLASDYPMQQSRALMQAIASSTGSMSNNPAIDGSLSEDCWNGLREGMARNSNQYSLVVAGIYGDNGTHIPGGTGSDQVVINVVFPDGSWVELNFYADTLNMCELH